MVGTTSTFGTYQNLINVLQQNSIIGIIACGMTFAIILGGFDLSVGLGHRTRERRRRDLYD